MKNHHFLSKLAAIMIAAMFSNAGYAQITYSQGKLTIGDVTPHKFLGMTIGGMAGTYWTCKANNFFQLDLSPASPRLAGTGDEVCFYNTETSTFNSIQVANVYNYSDERAKTNVKTIDGGLNTILNLRPVSYTWKSGIGSATRSSHLMTVANGPSCDKNLQFGFLAQELEEVIPDAVKTDEEGRKLINYTAIIPILVKSIQDLQGKVEEQQRMLEYLSKGSVYNSTHKELGHINKCVSDQSSSTLSIDFTLSQQAKDGILLISGIEGVQEKKIELSKFSSSITENISSLNKGVHIATLVINGSVCDSKQFIIE